nr:MAG TPA: hypothetical protein [Caudoviricetes sp.]
MHNVTAEQVRLLQHTKNKRGFHNGREYNGKT